MSYPEPEPSTENPPRVTRPTPELVSGLVLAGGRARRMGGEDKGLITLGGKAMVQWVSESLVGQCASVRVNANRNLQRYESLTGLTVVNDQVGDFAGPLAGMAAGLASCPTPWMVCTPCDSPLVAPTLVNRLCQAVCRDDAQLAVAHDGDRLQPVFVLLSRELLPDMQRFLAGGGRKIDAWYGEHRMALAPFEDSADMFLNVNTPEDRDALEARLDVGPDS